MPLFIQTSKELYQATSKDFIYETLRLGGPTNFSNAIFAKENSIKSVMSETMPKSITKMDSYEIIKELCEFTQRHELGTRL